MAGIAAATTVVDRQATIKEPAERRVLSIARMAVMTCRSIDKELSDKGADATLANAKNRIERFVTSLPGLPSSTPIVRFTTLLKRSEYKRYLNERMGEFAQNEGFATFLTKSARHIVQSQGLLVKVKPTFPGAPDILTSLNGAHLVHRLPARPRWSVGNEKPRHLAGIFGADLYQLTRTAMARYQRVLGEERREGRGREATCTTPSWRDMPSVLVRTTWDASHK